MILTEAVPRVDMASKESKRRNVKLSWIRNSAKDGSTSYDEFLLKTYNISCPEMRSSPFTFFTLGLVSLSETCRV